MTLEQLLKWAGGGGAVAIISWLSTELRSRKEKEKKATEEALEFQQKFYEFVAKVESGEKDVKDLKDEVKEMRKNYDGLMKIIIQYFKPK